MGQMFCYFNQPCTPSFPVGLVKIESDFIVRSDETGLERWMLVVAVVTDPPDSKETETPYYLSTISDNFGNQVTLNHETL